MHIRDFICTKYQLIVHFLLNKISLMLPMKIFLTIYIHIYLIVVCDLSSSINSSSIETNHTHTIECALDKQEILFEKSITNLNKKCFATFYEP